MIGFFRSLSIIVTTTSSVGRVYHIISIYQPYASLARCFNVKTIIFLFLALLVLSSEVSAKALRILAFGDSLTAGFGLKARDSFPSQLEAALKESALDSRVINAGVSGDTTAGGLARVDWVMQVQPDLVILELGANDGLRGLDPAETKRNLDSIIRRILEKGAVVVLTGMRAPPNLGQDYGARFNNIFPALAKAHKLPFYPFFLDRVVAEPGLNQSDGIHPNAKGVAIIVSGILPLVKRALENVK
ncbi:MAG: arylesterase [Rhodospirillaceae bacterium]|nr:arylesterase [Rhodospirillaceae bacterium]|tara:strand:+ start:62 stop:796 length:735 start_codon:yes stop_codon:yes gene_type:complete